MTRHHKYATTIEWTGNKAEGTLKYAEYDRAYTISIAKKPNIFGSSDPAFRGDGTKYNPEELLLASLSSCHMLWYLHLCAVAGVVVTNYVDNAKGVMIEDANGSGKFAEVILKPMVTVTDSSMIEEAKQLHMKANKHCFIANSVNFKVSHNPIISTRV